MTAIKTYNSNQIGGNVVVIETAKSKIAIDFGENLPGNETENIEIEGLSKGKASFDGVFFTHYHGDHIGRRQHILPEIPLYMGEIARKVLININTHIKEEAAVKFLKDEDRIFELHENEPVYINDGDIIVTPYSVDHSAYEAFMFLIETKDEGGNTDKVILHTGDFREQGYRGKALIPLIKKYIRKFKKREVDILIIEGTMFSRMKEKVFTEQELQKWATDFFKDHRHIFLLCSSTNLDSLASFYQAGQKYNMNMFGNKYVVAQLQTFSEIAGQKSSLYKFDKLWKIDFNKQLEKGSFKGTQEDYMRKYGFVCLVKESETYEKWIERFKDCNPTVIYSMWEGYLDSKKSAYNEKLDRFCKKYNAVHKHTSGHATGETIAKVIETVNPKEAIYPIHTENPKMVYNLNISEELKEKIILENGTMSEKSERTPILFEKEFQKGGIFENVSAFVEKHKDELTLESRGKNPDNTTVYYKDKENKGKKDGLFLRFKQDKTTKDFTMSISIKYANYIEDGEERKDKLSKPPFNFIPDIKDKDYWIVKIKRNHKPIEYKIIKEIFEIWQPAMSIRNNKKKIEDTRTVTYADEFCEGGELEPITKFVKEQKNNLILLFRGNSSNKSIVYYNNHKFWEIEPSDKGYKISISVNHAPKKDLKNIKKELIEKYDFPKDCLEKEKEMIGKVFHKGELTDEYLENFYEYWECKMHNFFVKANKSKCCDDFNELEKIRQHQIFLASKYKNMENGYFVYDLEYQLKGCKDTDINKPDFLAIRFENGSPKNLVAGEVKSTLGACDKSSGVYEHVNKMGRMLTSDREDEIKARCRDVVQIMADYEKIGLYNAKKISLKEDEKLPIEFLLIFTDESIEWLLKRIKYVKQSNKKAENELFLQILKNKMKNGDITSECKIKSKYEEEFVKCVELTISADEYLKAKEDVEGF